MAEKKKPVSEWLPQVVAWVRSLITQSDYAQNNSAAPDYIKNRTHYVENVSTSVWNQTGCTVGSGTTSPGGYPTTFNITTGNKYNVTISQGSTSKTYEGLTAEYDSTFNGLALRKNWSDSMGMSDTSTDALLLVVQPSNVVLRSADIYGENCTVQVSEVTETIHKLDPKYLPDNVNQLESITTSKSGKVTTVTFEQTNGTETQFQVTDGNDGTNGKSAYQVAVDNGYSGTEAQWLASLKGADGVSLGEVELTQEVTTETDSVPANKAVYDKVQRLTETDIEDILATGEAKEPTLPLGYTELEWIYNENGSSGIDTGLIPNDANWRFVGSWARMKPGAANYAAVFTAHVAEGYTTYRIIRNNNNDNQVLVYNHCTTSAGKQIALSNTAVDIWHTFDLSYGSITLDGTTTSLNTTQGTANTATLKLLNGSYYAKSKTFKAYHNDVLVGNFVPAKRDSDGEIGMYDTVTNTFFEHINSNPFVAGPEIGGGRDRILNGEGLSKAISTTLDNPNKLPTVQAVKDGVEVWRDDIEYIYKASDLTFDGSNYVDTGWNPYNPEGDFYIKMEISDLVLAGMENSVMIISCCKQISPYPGFAIRRDGTSNYQIAVYIDGQGRWNTTVNTGAGSKNTIIFSRVGNVYTFQVNGGTENKFTSTTTYNVDATNLYIGAQLNTDLTTFFRYGKFHLDSLVIARHEAEDIQLYSDYTKDIKIYPKTTIENVENLQDFIVSGVQTGTGFELEGEPRYIKLNEKQITWLNSSDTMTLMVSQYIAEDSSRNQYYRRYHRHFNSLYAGGLQIRHNSDAAPIINNITTTANRCLTLLYEINRVEGTVKIYSGDGILIWSGTNNAFIMDKFVGEDGIFSFDYSSADKHGGSYFTNYAIFVGSVMTSYKAKEFSTNLGYTPSIGLSYYFRNFETNHGNPHTPSFYHKTYDTISTGSDYAIITRNQGSTKTGYTSGPYYETGLGTVRARMSVTPFDVLEGYITCYPDKVGLKNPGIAKVCVRNQDGSAGAEVSDYSNIGVGEYIFFATPQMNINSGGICFDWGSTENNAVSVKVYSYTLYYLGCICNIRCGMTTEGRLLDTMTNESIKLYSNSNCTNEAFPTLTNINPEKIGLYDLFGTFLGNRYVGKIYTNDNGNTYIDIKNGNTLVAKQINNS